MGKSLELLIDKKKGVIELAEQYGIDELKYVPLVFPSEQNTVNLLATRIQPSEKRQNWLVNFGPALKEMFGINANVFTPEGINEGLGRESSNPSLQARLLARYKPIIDRAFPLTDITQQNAQPDVVETPSYDVSELVARYRKRMRTDSTPKKQATPTTRFTDKKLPAFDNVIPEPVIEAERKILEYIQQIALVKAKLPPQQLTILEARLAVSIPQLDASSGSGCKLLWL